MRPLRHSSRLWQPAQRAQQTPRQQVRKRRHLVGLAAGLRHPHSLSQIRQRPLNRNPKPKPNPTLNPKLRLLIQRVTIRRLVAQRRLTKPRQRLPRSRQRHKPGGTCCNSNLGRSRLPLRPAWQLNRCRPRIKLQLRRPKQPRKQPKKPQHKQRQNLEQNSQQKPALKKRLKQK